jgi:Arc/MetJ-type ribon-helix-helix transcriptional regulator
MKVKLSIALDEELLSQIDSLVNKGIFRNRSHAIDFSITYGGVKNGR